MGAGSTALPGTLEAHDWTSGAFLPAIYSRLHISFRETAPQNRSSLLMLFFPCADTESRTKAMGYQESTDLHASQPKSGVASSRSEIP
jgi:hypothetical protein